MLAVRRPAGSTQRAVTGEDVTGRGPSSQAGWLALPILTARAASPTPDTRTRYPNSLVSDPYKDFGGALVNTPGP